MKQTQRCGLGRVCANYTREFIRTFRLKIIVAVFGFNDAIAQKSDANSTFVFI